MTQTHFTKPSPKVVSIGIIVLAVIVSAVLLKSPRKQNTTPVENIVAAQAVRNTVAENDSDTDGLKDWEEILWRTDPKNPDTDRDGTGDFAEVQARKEATVALQENIINSATSSYFSFWAQDDSLTKTEALSRALFEQVIAFDTAGIPLSQENAADIASLLGEAIITDPGISAKNYATNDLNILTNATDEQIHAYGNNVAGALKVETSEQNNEFFALVEFMETGNTASLKKLAPVIAHYENVLTRLQAVATPKETVESHLSLMNRLGTTVLILEQLMNLSEDSVVVLPILQTYQNNYEATAGALRAIAVYLKSKNVEYSDFEDGYLLVTVY